MGSRLCNLAYRSAKRLSSGAAARSQQSRRSSASKLTQEQLLSPNAQESKKEQNGTFRHECCHAYTPSHLPKRLNT